MKIKISLLFMLFYALTSNAQIAFNYDQNQILLNLNGLSEQEIHELLQEVEADELWVSPLSTTRCWNFSAFPGVHEVEIDGETVYLYDIIDASELIKSRTSGGTSGVSISINPLPNYPIAGIGMTNGFFNSNLYIQSGTNEVLLSILDSGKTNDIDDSQGYVYNPDIISSTSYVAGTNQNDENGHGTHVTGIGNHIATYLSPNANVIDFDIRKILNAENKGDLGAYILAVEEAIVAGAQVLNLSLCFPEVEDNYFVNILVKLLEKYNLLGVVAAGNDGFDLANPYIFDIISDKNIFPAALQSPNLITVASLSSSGMRLSSFSNYGFNNVDVAVPGEMIAGYNIDSEFIGMSGTSQATAIVSGIAANLGTHQSTFDGAAIKCAIMNSVDHVAGLEGKIVSEGIVNAESALAMLINQPSCMDEDADRIIPTTIVATSVYPNPFQTALNMHLNEGTNEISVSDIVGKVIYTSIIEAPNGGMTHRTDDIQTIPKGVYMLTIDNKRSGIIQTKKLIKN